MNVVQQAIVDRLEAAGARGLSSDRLLDLLYRDDPNGGPETARKTMHARVWRINQHLKKQGRVIRATHGGGPGSASGIYRLIRTE